MLLLERIAKNRKNGAPKNAVTTPIGTSVGLRTLLPIVSQASRKNPPAKALIGIKTMLLEVFSIMRSVCGMISPTKPIMPVNATENATAKDETISRCFFIFSTSTPRL